MGATTDDAKELVDQIIDQQQVLAAAQAKHAHLMLTFSITRRRLDQTRITTMRSNGADPRYTPGEFAALEIGLAIKGNKHTVARTIGIARRLKDETPDAWDAWQAGHIDHDRAARINKALIRLTHDTSKQLLNALVVDVAIHKTAELLSRWLNEFVARVEPDQTNDRLHRSLDDRYVSIRPDIDGISFLNAAIASADADAINQVLNALAAIALPGDTRTVQQRRADACTELLLGKISNGCHVSWQDDPDEDEDNEDEDDNDPGADSDSELDDRDGKSDEDHANTDSDDEEGDYADSDDHEGVHNEIADQDETAKTVTESEDKPADHEPADHEDADQRDAVDSVTDPVTDAVEPDTAVNDTDIEDFESEAVEPDRSNSEDHPADSAETVCDIPADGTESDDCTESDDNRPWDTDDDWDLPASAFRPDPHASASDTDPTGETATATGEPPNPYRKGRPVITPCPNDHQTRPIPATIGVIISAQSLFGYTNTPGQLTDRSTLIPADLIRDLAQQPGTLFHRLLTDEKGNLLDVTEMGRFPSRRLGTAIDYRDGTCTTPICTTPAHKCDHDHVIPVPEGPTTAVNLNNHCRPEHRAKTHAGHHTTREGNVTTWTTPTGHTYTTTDQAFPVEEWPTEKSACTEADSDGGIP